MEKDEIKKILPHRDDMLLLDRAELCGDVAHGEKKITGDEFFLRGHFPGNPVVPGVILCEILAQSSCVLLKNTITSSCITYLTGIDKARFKTPVKPGDTFCTECIMIKAKPPFYFVSGKGYVDKKLCVSAEFSFMVAEG